MRYAFACLALILLPALCQSQVQEQLSPTERKQQTIVTEPVTLYKGFFRAGMGGWYNVIDKVFVDSDKKAQEGNIWGNSFAFSFYGQYGITDRLMVEILVPYVNDNIYQSVLYQVPFDADEQYLYPRSWKSTASGMGDVDLTLGYQLIRETLTRPALAGFVTATLPTGEKNVVDDGDDNPLSFDRPTGQGEFAVNTVLRLRQVRYPFSYSISAAYKYRTETTKVIAAGEPAVNYRNGNIFNITGSFNLHLNDWIAFKNIADFSQIGQDVLSDEKTGERGWLVQYLPGVSFQLKRLRFDQGVMIPLLGNNVAADPGYILIVQYMF